MFLTTSSFLRHFCFLFLLFIEKHYFVVTNLSRVKKQLRQLPPSWVIGWFDKGTSASCAGWKNFWYPRFKKAFFQQPKRFSGLLHAPTPAGASEHAFRYIVSRAKSFLSREPDPPDDKQLQPDLCAHLHDRVQSAKAGAPKMYTMSHEFVDTWRQALSACDTKLQRYIARTRYLEGSQPLSPTDVSLED